jgi:hypothetical protein
MKLSTLQMAFGVSILTHALAVSVVSLASHGRGDRGLSSAVAEGQVMQVILLPEQTVAPGESEESPTAASPESGSAAAAPAELDDPPAQPEPEAVAETDSDTAVAEELPEPSPEPVDCSEELSQNAWPFTDELDFPDFTSAASSSAGEHEGGEGTSGASASANSAEAGAGPSTAAGSGASMHAG